MTGVYEGLQIDLFAVDRGLDNMQAVPTGGGPSRSPEDESRATREQIYLALRLALADHLARDGEPLPIILDDVAVDFDPNGLDAAIRLLGDIGAQRQVLFFTCHPEVMERSIDAGLTDDALVIRMP
jgi:uncharacterized protein YhaN